MKKVLRKLVLIELVIVICLGYAIAGKLSQTDKRVLAQHTDSCGGGFSCVSTGGTNCTSFGGTIDICTNASGVAGNCCYPDNPPTLAPPTATSVPTALPTATPTPICTCTSCTYTCVSDCSAQVYCTLEGLGCNTLQICDPLGSPPYYYPVFNSNCCLGGSPTPVGAQCNATSCSNICGLGGCPGGCGNIDDCGGVDCGPCAPIVTPTDTGGGGGPTATPVPPGCEPNCMTSACVPNTCSNQVCVGNCGQYCYGTMTPTVPAAPLLVSPANGSTVSAGTIPLRWSMGSWGTCNVTDTFDVCVGTNAVDPCVGGILVSNLPSSQLIYNYVQNTAGTYYWKVGADNDTGLPMSWSAVWSFIINVEPTITDIFPTTNTPIAPTPTSTGATIPGGATVTPASPTPGVGGTVVVTDPDGKIHNHMVDPDGDPLFPDNKIDIVITFNDPNGYDDVTTVIVTWNGNTYNGVITGGSGNNGTAVVTIDIDPGTDYDPGTYPIMVTIIDSHGGSSVADSGIDLHAWDGMVQVYGNMYDATDEPSGAVCATGVGFSQLANASMNFSSVDITKISGVGSVTNVPAASENSYPVASTYLTWGQTYLMAANASATNIRARWIDVGVGTTSCGNQQQINAAVVDPYQSNPRLKVDFAGLMDQEPWYQTVGGGIMSRTRVENSIPITCYMTPLSCTAAMSIASAGKENSIVSGSTITNNSDCTYPSQCLAGSPNNFSYSGSIISESYGYYYFYNNYFVRYGLGKTLPAGATMTQALAALGPGGTGVVLVNGNFVVDTDNTLAANGFLMVVAKGSIVFNNTVTRSDGVFVADGGINLSGTNVNQMVINGSLFAANGSDVDISRGFVDKTENNLMPGVVVNYNPALIFNMPGNLTKVVTDWRITK